MRYGDVQVSGRAASSLTCSLFDLYDVDNDGSLSFAEFSCGLITLLSLLELGRGRCDEANALAATFAVLDVDGSGYLEAKELEAWVRVLRRLGGALPQDAHRDAYGFEDERRVGGRRLARRRRRQRRRQDFSVRICAAGPKAQPRGGGADAAGAARIDRSRVACMDV